MTALELFKTAGLEDYLQSGAVGAGLGAAGMGLGSYMFGDHKKDRGKNALKDALKGALLGGAAGAGYEGIKDVGANLFRTPGRLDANELANSNPELDTRTHAQGHPIESAALSASAISPYTTAGAGAVGGTLLEKLKRNVGKSIFASGSGKNSAPVDYTDTLNDLNSLKGIKDGGKLKQFLAKNLGDSDSAKIKAIEEMILQGKDTSGISHMFNRAADPSGVAQKAYNTAVDNLDGTSAIPGLNKGLTGGALNKLKGYAGAGLKGGLLAGAGQLGASGLMNAYMNTQHSPEQLQLWDRLASKPNY